MKKIIAVTVMGAALAAASSSAQAGLTLSYGQSGDTATSGDGVGGGEFDVTPNIPSGWGANALDSYASTTKTATSFRSFCLERDEYTMGGTLDAVISSSASLGGQNLTSPDPLSLGTAWLYSRFAQGTLTGYDYNNVTVGGRDASAGLLQAAIWALEEETSTPDQSANPYYIAAMSNGGMADAPAGYLGVYALNITTTNPDQYGANRQDMLYYAVPEPSTWFAGIGALGLLGVSAFRRSSAVKAVAAN